MASGSGDVSIQDAIWFSAELGYQFQTTSRIMPAVRTLDIGRNKTYTGQYVKAMASNAVGNVERPVFQTAQIVAYQADVQAWECPCFVEDVSLSNIQFGASVMGKVVSSIGMELGRRADRIFIAGMNAQYDPSNTLDLNGYYNVQGLSQARNMLGQKAVSGRLINLIDYEQFNNLLTDDRFSNWFFNNDKPLALDYPTPALDQYFNYQGMLFIKLADQTPLPKNAAGETRTFMFSTESCLLLLGSVDPYGLFGVQTQFQVHRGGWDINNRTRLGFVLEQTAGCLAVEAQSDYRPMV
jgi:hypothetical protein